MRRFFGSQAEAVQWADEFERNLKLYGLQHIQTAGKTVNQVLERFWALKEIQGLHRSGAKSILTQFSQKHGSAPIKAISPIQLQAFWTREEWGKTYRFGVYRYLRLFFNWAERYDFIDRNPIRRVEVPKAGDPPKTILRPEKMAEYLTIDDPLFHAFICLGGFAGLRTSEILELRPDDIGRKEIHVRGGKTGERFVTILPTFKRHWWGLFAFHESKSRFYKHVRAVTGGNWPDNCLRHSFGSYHLSMWEEAGRTAFQMGNSEAVVRRAYARAVPKSEAKKWWAI